MKNDNKYLSGGDIEYAQSNDISIMKWKDRGSKPVTLISNMHNTSKTTIVLRRNQKGEKIRLKYPKGIGDYNKYMTSLTNIWLIIQFPENFVDGG